MKLNVRVTGDGVVSIRLGLAVVLLLLAAVGALLWAGKTPVPVSQSGIAASTGVQSPATNLRVALAHAPLSFEPNQGQTDPRVKFLSQSSGYALFLTGDEAVLKIPTAVASHPAAVQKSVGAAGSGAVLRMKLEGAQPGASVSGDHELSSKSNYLVGNDPAKWRVNVPHYARVRYEGIYPGIDLVYYGNQGRLEYDFNVAPGGDAKQIQLSFGGANHLRLDGAGNLIAHTGAGEVKLHAPDVYQLAGGVKQPVSAKFVIAGRRAGFELGQYDRGRELVIDPTLTYSTYLGGSLDEGCLKISGAVRSGCPAIAVDGAHNMYVAGTTDSTFPTTAGAFQTTLNGTANVFVTKYNAAGSQFLFSTYLGGTGTDSPVGIAVDPFSGNVLIAGNTTSTNFPFKNGFQGAPLSGGNHVFVTVLNSAGTGLVYSTYLSGNGVDTAAGLAADNRANAYVMGYTTSNEVKSGFPSTAAGFQTASRVAPGGSQFFFTKINTAGSGAGSIPYSSYLGGSVSASGNPLTETQGGGIAVDASGNIYLTGGTDFQNMPILNAEQSTFKGGVDSFVAKFNSAGRVYLTYLGGTGDDVANGISVDAAGNAYVTGSTNSPGLSSAAGTNPFQPCLNSGSATTTCPAPTASTDGFLAKIGNPAASTTTYPLNYFSYIGGSGDDAGLAIAVDGNQVAHIVGSTASSDFHVTNSSTLGGLTDAFVAHIPTTSSSGSFSTYLGGTGDDDATSVASDENGASYVAGETSSSGFPLVQPQQPSLLGTSDAFVSKFSPVSVLAFTAAPSVTPPAPIGVGNQVTFNYTIANTGAGTDIASNVIFTAALPSGATFNTVTATPGACTAAINASVTCSIGTLGVGATAKVAINVTPTVAGIVSSSATATANGANTFFTSATAAVTDFAVAATPATATVAAGNSVTYQVTASPRVALGFPNSVSIGCSAGLPTGAACTFSTNPVTPNTSPVSSTLTITTTARPVTTGAIGSARIWYAALVPISGFAFWGVGMGSVRRRRSAMILLALVMLSLAGLQLACGSGSGTTTTATGTPAGSYPITVTGTSGSVSHATKVFLVVQ